MNHLRIYKQKYIIALLFLIAFLSISWLEPLNQMFTGYWKILISPSILLTDYLAVGGLAATLFNVLTTLLFNYILIKSLKLHFTGPILAVLMTIVGFSFFGKNVLNALPMYLGVYLYAKATKTEYKNHIIVLLLSTGISPIVSYITFGIGLELYIGLPLAIIFGALIGFILPASNTHALRFHQGYNLYSTGFSMGVIAMVGTAIMHGFGHKVKTNFIITYDYHWILFFGLLVLSLLFILISFIYDKKPWKNYPNLLKSPGRLVTDFYRDHGIGTTLLNIGIMGLLSLVLVLVMKIQISGPMTGAIFTVMGFAAFGKHPFNSIPVVLGGIIAYWLFMFVDPSLVGEGTKLALLFVTGLAPVAGQYGLIPGMVAGFLHLLIVPFALSFQGGFDLYNNGFAAGFIAAITVPIFDLIIHTREVRRG
ncbi:MAG: DUF1576 domain-containing protein [Acholeplasmataceae bacterium]|nr:DUF1576 domain-containing protein [Acholeplasmataceae bacterium]